MVECCWFEHVKLLTDVIEGDVSGEYGSVVRPQVPQYVTLQILAILQPYPQERDARDQCISSDIGELFHQITNERRFMWHMKFVYL